MKSLRLGALAVGCLVVCSSLHAGATACAAFGQTAKGTISSAGQTNACTFSGNDNDILDFTMTTTSGTMSPEIQLYNSSGKLIASAANRYANGACAGGTVVEMNTVQLPATDTYTVIVGDCAATNTGTYSFYSQRIDSPLGAANLPFGGTEPGTIGSAAQNNTYTFSANANDVVDFTMSTTTGSIYPRIRLYDPSGKLVIDAANRFANGACAGGSTWEANSVALSSSGTYVVLLADCSDTNTGTYNIYLQRANNPSGAASLPFGQTESATIGAAAQSNTYSFKANANDVVDFTMSTTTGSIYPRIRLYDPSGKLMVDAANRYANGTCAGGSIWEADSVTLPTTGTYVVLLGDCTDVNTGTYDIYAQRTDSPPGTTLAFGKTVTGDITAAAQSNTYTFHANVNDVVDLTMTTTSGSLYPRIRIYGPTGKLVVDAANRYANGACAGGTTWEADTVALSLSGTYTVLLGDCTDQLTGKYAAYLQRTNNPSGASMILLGHTQTGSLALAAQNNSYVFSGSQNDVFDFTMRASGFYPRIRLYNPTGTLLIDAANRYANGSCAGGTVWEANTVKLPATGMYTLLLGDCTDANVGNYVIYGQRTNSPFGYAPIVWGGKTVSGTLSAATQNNTYTFGGTANNTIDMTMVTTSGSASPRIRLYNPDGSLVADVANRYANGACAGGSTITLSSVTLAQTGIYTVLAADCSDTNTGSYNLSGQCFGTCPAMPPISWARPASITHGTPLSATQLDATSSVAGSMVYTPPSTTVLGQGPKNLSVVLTPTDTTNYSKAEDSVQLMVNAPPHVSPTSLSFGNEALNQTSAAKTVTFTNAVTGPLTISSITASTNFAVASTTCVSPLAAGKQCTVSITFTPSALGGLTGALSITDNAPNSPQKVSLSGTGVVQASLTPSSAIYAAQKVGTSSPAKAFTLTNDLDVALTSIAISTTGDFAISGTTCTATLVAHGTCTVNVTFTPTQTGTRPGSLNVSDSASNSPQTSTLTGTGD